MRRIGARRRWCGGRAEASAAGADDGDNLVLGQGNAATVATTLTVGGDVGGVEPALALENADGPSLRMNALSHTWAGQLAVGEMAGTDLGPIVGVETAFGPTTTYLVTGIDLANMATPFASTPTRVLDLRTEAGRAAIIRRSSPGALAADGKLRAGQWIDVPVAFTGPDFTLDAVFANLTVVGPRPRRGRAALSAWGASRRPCTCTSRRGRPSPTPPSSAPGSSSSTTPSGSSRPRTPGSSSTSPAA